jgi:hypothetical protein
MIAAAPIVLEATADVVDDAGATGRRRRGFRVRARPARASMRCSDYFLRSVS